MREMEMNRKIEWELMEEQTASSARSTARQSATHLLGPWWRWKLIGGAALAGIVLALLAAITGVTLLLMSVAAAVVIVAGRLRRWIREKYAGSTSYERHLTIQK